MSQKKKAKQAEEAAQAKVQLLKVDEQKEQVAQVQLETKAYEDWKAKYEEETAAEIQLLNKQKQQYVDTTTGYYSYCVLILLRITTW